MGEPKIPQTIPLIPANAGIQASLKALGNHTVWIPIFIGMSEGAWVQIISFVIRLGTAAK